MAAVERKKEVEGESVEERGNEERDEEGLEEGYECRHCDCDCGGATL